VPLSLTFVSYTMRSGLNLQRSTERVSPGKTWEVNLAPILEI
jgi:hypothetical protein